MQIIPVCSTVLPGTAAFPRKNNAWHKPDFSYNGKDVCCTDNCRLCKESKRLVFVNRFFFYWQFSRNICHQCFFALVFGVCVVLCFFLFILPLLLLIRSSFNFFLILSFFFYKDTFVIFSLPVCFHGML